MGEWRQRAVTLLAIGFWGIIISYAWTQTMVRAKLGVVFVGAIFSIYLADRIDEAIDQEATYDIVTLAISGAITILTIGYIYFNFHALYAVRVGFALPEEYLLAVLFTAVVIFLSYKEFGRTFLVVLVGGILYALFGYVIPGTLGHAGLTPKRILLLLVLDMNGFFGFITQIVAAWLALFLLLAGLLETYGAFDMMIRASVKVSKYIESGVAQSAVVSSMIIGSINGSTAANTAITGSFTIPLMKKHGMRNESAGAIEAVASTVGQVLPPVMGAAAFIMASLLNISYLDVAIAGVIPAIVLVLSIGFGVHYFSLSESDGHSRDFETNLKPRSRRYLALESIRFLIPFLILVYFLGVARFTVMTSALYTIIAMIVSGTTIPIIRRGMVDPGYDSLASEGRQQFWNTIGGFKRGALSLAPIAIILVAINGVVTLLLTTGVPSKISLALINVSGGIELVAVVLALIVCLILGLGMPTAAAYLIVALLIAPTLIGQFGVPKLAAHFFVFYSAILAAVTPPVATSVAVATGIADSGFWETSRQAIKLALPLFVLPFVFILHPAIVSETPTLDTIFTGLLALVGALGIIHGLNYGEAKTRLEEKYEIVLRAAYVALGIITMTYPNEVVQTTAGMVIFIVVTRHSSTVPIRKWAASAYSRIS